jgi:hypothetical protein
MSEINSHNYEAFLLDYSEGNLDAHDIVRLKAFLDKHPELEIDLENQSLPIIEKEIISANFKSSLRKEETDLYNEELLDYIEGNLAQKEIADFEKKLLNDPDLSKELGLYRKVNLVPDPGHACEFKQEMIKTEDDLVLKNRIIAYVENTLSYSERTKLENELALNSGLQKELQLVSKTVLIPDSSIIYSGKDFLKKKNKVIVLFSLRTAGSVAAAILLLLGFALLYNYYKSDSSDKILIAKKLHGSKNKQEQILNNTKDTFANPQHFPGKNMKNIHIEKSQEKRSNANLDQMYVKEDLQKDNSEKDQPEIPIVKEEERQIQFVIEKQNPGNSKTEIALNAKTENNTDTLLEKHNYLLTAEETDEEINDPKIPGKFKLWKRVVRLAKQANKIGVKSIDGEEDSKNKFRISFNSFSVEKK